ncbi:hypothetical protein [Myroides fluvii]|uniref:hypothetical protein n=1 Tax=Myroides fluvii TaxID=2572594 RepID=UPI00131D9544|nr:hypothetical protein [Myroides fluvii]
MRALPIFLIFTLALGLASCTDKSKETAEPQRIKLEQNQTETKPVQIPMHGTRENSSSGMTSFKIKEDMKENVEPKNNKQE